MNDLPGLPPVSVDKVVGAPVPDPIDSLASGAEGQQAFDDALDDSADLHESQAPETRRAIKGSLDRLPGRQRAQAPPGHGEPKALQDRPGTGSQAESGSAVRSAAPGTATGEGIRGFVGTPAGAYAKTLTGNARQTARADSGSRTAGPGPGLAASPGAASLGSGGTAGRKGAATPEPGTKLAGTGTGAAERSVEGTAPGRSGHGNLARGNAANWPRPGGAGSPVRGTIAGAMRAGDTDTSSPGNAPPAAASAGEARRIAQGPGGPQVDRPRQSRPGEGIAGSSPERGIASRAAAKAETSGQDDAGVAEAQPADLTGLAPPAGAPEPRNIAAPETVQSPASRAVEIADQVADRILVAAPEPGTSGEVRISLRESVLDGSDVRIFREAGELRIVFLPRTEAAGQLLTDNGTVFQQALGERLQDEKVRVEVELPGRVGTDQQDNEGRSRQRYVSPDEPAGKG